MISNAFNKEVGGPIPPGRKSPGNLYCHNHLFKIILIGHFFFFTVDPIAKKPNICHVFTTRVSHIRGWGMVHCTHDFPTPHTFLTSRLTYILSYHLILPSQHTTPSYLPSHTIPKYLPLLPSQHSLLWYPYNIPSYPTLQFYPPILHFQLASHITISSYPHNISSHPTITYHPTILSSHHTLTYNPHI